MFENNHINNFLCNFMPGMYQLHYIYFQSLLFWKSCDTRISFSHSPICKNKLNGGWFLNLSFSAKEAILSKGVTVVNLTEERTQPSVKEVLTNFLIAKALLSHFWIVMWHMNMYSKKKYHLQSQTVLKPNTIPQPPGRPQDTKCSLVFPDKPPPVPYSTDQLS